MELKVLQHSADFHSVVDVIYANDANHIKHLESDVDAVFDRSHKKFQRGDAQRWILWENSKPIGRIAAFYEDKNGKRFGGWGFFECINNDDAAKILISEAENWLKENKATKIMAPVNFGSRDAYWGLLISSTTYPSYQENYQPSYYQKWFDSMGYGLEIEQTTYELVENDFNIERFSKIAERTMGNAQYRFEVLDFGQLPKFAADFVTIYNQAWSFHEDFEPLDVAEILKRFKSMKPAVIPELIVFAYHGEEPIGFYVNILELNMIFKDFGGKLTLWNKLRFLMSKGKIDRCRGVVFGVIPQYHNKGVEAGMIMKSYEGAKKNPKIKSVELAWIGDFNPKMLSMLSSLGAKLTKTHHTYSKTFS
jgi:hypothetical protein